MYIVEKKVLGKFNYWLDSSLQWNGLKENAYKFSQSEAVAKAAFYIGKKRYYEDYNVRLAK